MTTLPPAANGPQKLLIDTDPGDDVDDVLALALAFALRRPLPSCA